jgi:nitrite reductase/ring-hydroxylating ferredoxin subunit
MAATHFFKLMLEVSDLDRSETFYREDLGLQLVGRDLWPDDPPNSTFQTADGGFVELVQVENVRPDGPAQHRNFMLEQEDYKRVFQRLKERGWLRKNYRTEMGMRSIGEITCSLYDPDRHRLQLTAWLGEHVVPPSKRGKVVAGRIEDFPVGSVTYIKEGKFYLVHVAGGMIAVNEVCTHMHGILAYQPEHFQFYCHCHNRRFTRTGDQFAVNRDTAPLSRYQIEVVDGQVLVDTDVAIARTEDRPEDLAPVPSSAGVA